MPNFQPSSVINFTGSIAGSPASNVASNAFTSFNDTISFRDPVIPNGTLNAFSPNSGTATQDGNVVVNIDYTYTNGARVADYYIIFYKQGGGTVSPANPCIVVNPASGVASSARINVVPGSPYTFAFSSARVTRNGVIASSPQNQTARTMIAGNYTANIAGISAASIASAGKVVSATIDKQAINYSVTGAATPTSINITATTQNITTPYYTFYRDIGAGFVEIQARSTDNSLSAYSGIPPVNTAYQFKVEAHEGNVATVAASDFVTVYGLASGSNALTTIISNESHSIPADSTGSPTSYAGSGTTIRLYEGSTELTYVASAPAAGQWTVIASPTNITTGSLTATSGYLTVGNHSAITSSTASIDYNISGTRQNGTAIPSFKRIQSLVKTNAGTAGAGGSPAQYVIVTGDQAFRYSSDSTTAVPSQITLSAELYGGLTTYNWQYYNTTNSAWSPASVTTQTYTVSPATAGFTGNSFRVRCVSGAFTDEITLVKLFDGTNAKVGYLTNEAFVSTTNSSGGSPVYEGGNGVFKVFNGITDISTGAGTSYGILSGTGTPSPVASVTRNGLTLAIGASTGIYSPSGTAWSTNSESFTLRATTNAANGSVVIDKVFNIAKSRAGSPGATGTPGTNVATVYLYQRTTTTTSPTMPADAITYTFSSGNVNSPNTGWSSTIPSFTGTNPYLWVTLATASNSASTDTINSNEWQAAKLLSQNGSDGSPGAAGFSTAVLSAYIRSAFAPSTNPGTLVYTFSTSAWTPTNGWSKTIPSANGLPLWVVSATAFSTTSTDTVDSVDWSTPTKVLIDPTSAIGGNLTTQSENLAAWTLGSASVSPGISYIDGSTQFWKVYESTTASAYHDISGPTPYASISVGDRVTLSANVMKGERSRMVMYLATDPWSPSNWPISTFDLSAGLVLSNSATVADAGIFEVGNIGASKVYRIYITTVPATVAASTYPLLRTSLDDGTQLYASASPGSGFYATRAQLSKGYLAEYLKTDATIIQNNAIVGDAFTGTTELRVKSVPTNNATIGSITSVATADGNSVITVPITYTQGAVNADGAIVYYKEGNTGANSPANDHKGFSLDSTDSSTARNVQFTLKPNQAYNFSVRAYRRSEGGRKYTAFSAVSTHTSTAGNYTGNVNSIAASTVTTNAANGATAFTGTAKYRTAGAPTNLVSPTGITAPTNSNATKTIRVSWAPYTQGTNQADVIGLFYRRDNLIPTYTDSCVVMNVNVNTPAYYDLQGVNPADQYSFGIAAGRRTESGIEWGLINTTYGSGTFSLYDPDVSSIYTVPFAGGTISPWTEFTPNGETTVRVSDVSTTIIGGSIISITSPTISSSERWMAEGWVKKPTGGSLIRRVFRIYGSNQSYGEILFDANGTTFGAGVGYAEHSVETVNVDGIDWYRMYIAANISPGITTLISAIYPSVLSPGNPAWSPEFTGEVITGPIAIRKRVTTSAGFDWTAITASTVNFTGAIDGSPASQIRSGTANYRQDVSPTNNPSVPTITQSATADGNVVAKVAYTYSQGAIPADFVLIYAKEGGGTISPAVMSFATNAVSGDLSLVLKPSITYRFATQAVRRTETGIKGGNIISSADIVLTSPNYTGLISGSPAAAIVLNANTAFSGTAKYRTAGAPTNLPVPTGIVSTPNSNATKTIRISWAAYLQGANQADVIGIFYRRDNTIPTYIDTCVIMNVNLNTPGVFELTGVNPADPYSFGIAAGRRTEDGIEWSEINTTYGTNPYYLYSASYPLINAPATGNSVAISPWTDFTPNGEITYRITDDSVNFESAVWSVSPSISNLTTERWMAEAWIKQETGTTKTALFRVYASNGSYGDLILNPTNGNIVSVGGPFNGEGFVETVQKDAVTWYRVGVSSNISPNLTGIQAELYPTIGTIPSGAYSPDASGPGIVIGGVDVRKRTNSSAGFDWTAITASTVDFTGSIAGSPSTTVRDNARNAFDGTSEIRNTAVPTNNATIGSITSVATADGNSVITVPITYTQGAVNADGAIVYYKEGSTGANSPANDHKGFSLDSTDSSTARNLQFTLKPNQAYNFSVRAYRRAEGGRKYTAFSGVSTHTSTSGNYTGTIAGQTSTSVAQTVTVGTGNNLVPNSDYRSAMTATNGYNPNSATILAGIEYSSVNAPGWNGTYILNSETTQSLYIRQGSPVAGGDDAIGIDIYPYSTTPSAPAKIPVVANQNYCFSAYTQAHRAKTSVGIVYYDVSGSPLTYPESTSVLGSGGFTSTLNNFNRQFVIATAPGSASYAIVYVRKWNTTAGNADSYMWYAAPQFERVNASVTSPGAYMPGPAISTGQLGYSGDLNATWGAPAGTLVGGSPAATVAANAVSGSTAFTGTISFRDGVAPNGTGASISATTGTATSDGNVVVTVTYAYTNTGSRLADTYLIFVREGGGTVLSSDPCFASNPVSGTVQFTLKPSTSYTFGFSASRVTSSGNFATAITTSAGITTVAGNYTGNVYNASAETLAQQPVFEAYNPATFNFKNSTNGWTAAGANLSTSATYLSVSPTATDPQIRKLDLSFSGAVYDKIRARIRRRSGSAAWEGVVYYGTSAGPAPHGESGSYYKAATAPSNLDVWNIVEWDMNTLTAGGTDWINSTINRLRFDFSNDSTSNWDIDWITVGRTGIPTYGAEYGASPSNLIGLSGDGINRVLQRYAGGFTAVEGDPIYGNPNTNPAFPVSKAGGMDLTSVTFSNNLSGPSTGYYGSYAIKIKPLPTGTRQVYFSTASNSYNMPLDPNSKWILSAKTWAGSPASFPLSFNLGVLTATSPTTGYTVTQSIPTAQTWTNLSGILNLKNDSSTSGVLYASVGGGGSPFIWMDGVMLEKKVGPGTTPSVWSKSTQTGVTGTTKGSITVPIANLGAGNLFSGIGLNQGDGIARPVLSGLYVGYARDGDNITFPTAYSSTPTVVFLPGAKSTGSPVSVNQSTTYEAINLTTTGFTAKIKLTGLTSSVSPITDTVSVAGSPILSPGSPDSAGYTGNPAASYSINKSNAAEAWDDRYTFNYNVTINNIWTDTWEPGNATFGLYVRKTTGWYLVGTPTIFGGTGGATTTKNVSSSAIVDGIIRNTAAGQNEFAIRALTSSGTINSFTSVTYSVANAPTQQAGTEATSAAVPFIVIANSGST